MKKDLKINLKALLLIAAYLFFHIGSSFVAPPGFPSNKQHAVVKAESVSFVHLPKFAKTAISESRSSFHRLIQKASRLFTVLFFCAAATTAFGYLLPAVNRLVFRPTYLRYCVIRI